MDDLLYGIRYFEDCMESAHHLLFVPLVVIIGQSFQARGMQRGTAPFECVRHFSLRTFQTQRGKFNLLSRPGLELKATQGWLPKLDFGDNYPQHYGNQATYTRHDRYLYCCSNIDTCAYLNNYAQSTSTPTSSIKQYRLMLPFIILHVSGYPSTISQTGIHATVHLMKKVATVIHPPNWSNWKH